MFSRSLLFFVVSPNVTFQDARDEYKETHINGLIMGIEWKHFLVESDEKNMAGIHSNFF